MSFSESLVVPMTALVRAAEEGGEHALNPWLVGGGTLALLLLLLVGLVAFGGGRDHS
ncbi:hypothetical protein KUV85_02790 [Nocardioides panacisoli]|uniref:hypothetical protein n=1 Tax=Nocardioides panacisoli TaxID=627624 RepID=UPI001C626DC1|nr:hypothetical protein [Nocardioides panacisoli]QYJ04624.1 hypothetical protein KUV85_02790 [Nocardioides panacisoli]